MDLTWTWIADKALTVAVGILGALLSYLLTSRHERIKQADVRNATARSLASALLGELEGAKAALEGRVQTIENAIDRGVGGGNIIDKTWIGELYRANLDKVGLLGPTATPKAVQAYGVIRVTPTRLEIAKNAEHSDWPRGDREVYKCAPNFLGLPSFLHATRSALGIVNVAIDELAAYLRDDAVRG